MATNNFRAFGIGAGANVTSQSDYEALAALLTGFQSGKASSAQINKALRQSTTMANVLAQFISDSASVDVLDNGTPAAILANLKSAMTAITSGRLLNIQTITTSGTIIPTPGAKKWLIKIVGGGGGGGGVAATSNSQQATATGGECGWYAELLLTNLAASYSCAIGAAGVGGAAGVNAGTAGGATSIANVISAPGGQSGAGGAAQGSATSVVGTSTYTGAPTVSAGTLLFSIAPQRGDPQLALGTGIGEQKGGSGGDSPFGRGGRGGGGGGTSAGGAGQGRGTGGGGASIAFSTQANKGGDGTAGMIMIEEYA